MNNKPESYWIFQLIEIVVPKTVWNLNKIIKVFNCIVCLGLPWIQFLSVCDNNAVDIVAVAPVWLHDTCTYSYHDSLLHCVHTCRFSTFIRSTLFSVSFRLFWISCVQKENALEFVLRSLYYLITWIGHHDYCIRVLNAKVQAARQFCCRKSYAGRDRSRRFKWCACNKFTSFIWRSCSVNTVVRLVYWNTFH